MPIPTVQEWKDELEEEAEQREHSRRHRLVVDWALSILSVLGVLWFALVVFQEFLDVLRALGLFS